MSHTPQEAVLEDWLRKRNKNVFPLIRRSGDRNQKGQNPKWTDDKWFEERYGDPDYYHRIKGL